MKIIVKRPGKSTYVYRTDSAVIIAAKEGGTTADVMIENASPEQIYGILHGLKSSMFRIMKGMTTETEAHE